LLVIADHGNCELMTDPTTGEPHTAHTTNPVPCILYGAGQKEKALRGGGRLADVAPTLLELLQLKQPVEMTGRSLLHAGEQDTCDAIAVDPETAQLKEQLAAVTQLLLGVARLRKESRPVWSDEEIEAAIQISINP